MRAFNSLAPAEQPQRAGCEMEEPALAVEDAMDIGKKLSKSQLKELQKKWSSSRRKKSKAKKLGGKKAHTRW